MPFSPASLNKYVPWSQALSVMGIDVPAGAPPFTVKCPLCGERRLAVHQDSIFGGAWHYCFCCQTSGDLLELAAKAWGCDLFGAVIRFSQEGVDFPEGATTPEGVDQYQEDYLVPRDRLDRFWDRCRRLLAGSPMQVTDLMRKFGLRKELPESLWYAGPGQYVGACNVLQAAQAFAPAITKAKISTQQLFRGPGWHDVLVIPFMDLPGRISGFLFIGRNGEPDDFVFRSIWAVHVLDALPGR
jgi:hypothetical protein